jgi:hypothetical protein
MEHPTKDQFLRRLREERWKSSEPDDDCLEPEEVEDYCAAQTLPPERLKHLNDCPDCRGLVAAAMPSEEQLARFLGEVRSHAKTR